MVPPVRASLREDGNHPAIGVLLIPRDQARWSGMAVFTAIGLEAALGVLLFSRYPALNAAIDVLAADKFMNQDCA